VKPQTHFAAPGALMLTEGIWHVKNMLQQYTEVLFFLEDRA